MADLAPKVQAVLVLDDKGKRIACKYYTDVFGDYSKQLALEKEIHKKASRTSARVDAEVLIYQNKHVVLYKFNSDVFYYVIAGVECNELIMEQVLSALDESLINLLRNQVDRDTLFQSLDFVLLAINEIVDDGCVLETDPSQVAARVMMRGAEGEVPFAEQSMAQALQTVRKNWLK